MNFDGEFANQLWAKTGKDEVGEIDSWLPLPVHLRDTAEIARLLARHRLSRQQRATIEPTLPADTALETLAWLLGALHDIGKAGPNFQAQCRPLAAELFQRTFELTGDAAHTLNVEDADEISSQSEFPHSAASGVITARVLAEEYGLRTAPRPASGTGMTKRPASPGRPFPAVLQLASIVGAHHGITAPEGTARDYILGGDRWPLRLGTCESPWHRVQRHLARTLIDESELDLDGWRDPDLHLEAPVLSLLTGLVIQADWIASNQELFPLIGLDEDITACAPSSQRAAAAWKALSLPPRSWTPVPEADPAFALRSRFSLPAGTLPRPGQLAAHAATIGLLEPALLILEDETGAGKTEAALLAAENLAALTGASGVYIGLPTQATANAMFPRAQAWVAHMRAEEDEAAAVMGLAHGKTAQNREYQNLRRRTGQARRAEQAHGGREHDQLGRGIDADGSPVVPLRDDRTLPDEASVDDGNSPTAAAPRPARILRPTVHSWLAGRKKQLLSDFVIGTIDQLLMAALKSRHLMLRHSGLADKVVILDEAHAADTTMQVFMRSALVWLGYWGVPTIVLTATLPPAQRTALIEAYQRGRAADPRRVLSANQQSSSAPHPGQASHSDEAIYPALTLATASEVKVVPVEGRPPRRVRLQELDDDPAVLLDTVRALSRDGGCIAIIRNSVRRVQETAGLLREEFGEDAVTVAHAGFTATDRAERDRMLLELFGRDSAHRPAFSLVVASQVIEQSLDVDFDAVITDMCPADLLIQRLGRVHRHGGRSRPAPLREPVCYLTGIPDWSARPPMPDPGWKRVYGAHLILRSIAAVREVCGQNGVLTTPDDVPALVHRVYGEHPLGPADWQPALEKARKEHLEKQACAERLADQWVTVPTGSETTGEQGLDGWLNVGVGEAEDPYGRQYGQVRDGSESIEVLLVLTDGTDWRTLDWLPRTAGAPIPSGDVPRHIAEAVASSAVRLPFRMASGDDGSAVITALEKLGRAEFQRSPLLRGQLILPLEETSGDDETVQYTARVGKWIVTYDLADGLSASDSTDVTSPGKGTR
ncbi:CRISPR-associated helicase/endonuclease Cas3 [Brevibacterium album]|uniref:CRISPR-associated helicase/endonuclease Cas3 n=1 Tax=Brevibacterium album TaxID=417948 RepID=UPI0003FEADD3|nr:CRISPR-associated helicase/endonuclease Cas3 [Brevibacterium album]